MKTSNQEQDIQRLIESCGENPSRQGLIDTPKRFLKAWSNLTSGYTQNLDDVINGALFDSDMDEMVVVKDIELYSLCEHHLLPFFGKVHVSYIPNGKIVGLSKIPRICATFWSVAEVSVKLRI